MRPHDRKVHKLLTGTFSKRFILVPLQVHDDSQKIYHSDYDSVEDFIAETIRSFSAHAAEEQVLCFKHHPMDRGYTHYAKAIKELALQHDVQGRVFYCHDNSLPELYRHAASVVTVNSTVGLSALLHRLPVKTMGKALYDIPDLTHQGALDSFWQNPQPVDEKLFKRFHSLLFTQTQINGSFFTHFDLSCRNAQQFYQTIKHPLKNASSSPSPSPSSTPNRTAIDNMPELGSSDIPLEAA